MHKYGRYVAILAILCTMVFIITQQDLIFETLFKLIKWAEGLVITIQGVIFLTLCYAFATLCFLPGGLLTLGIGYTLHHVYDSVFIALVLGGSMVLIGA